MGPGTYISCGDDTGHMFLQSRGVPHSPPVLLLTGCVYPAPRLAPQLPCFTWHIQSISFLNSFN